MAANYSSFILPLLCLCLLHGATDLPLPVSCSSIGFSGNLSHHNSTESLFHDPSSTTFARLRSTVVRRSAIQAKQFRHATSLRSNSLLIPSASLFVKIRRRRHSYIITASFGIGNPRQELNLHADTGSDLSWALDRDCRDQCYSHSGRPFNTGDSSTHNFVLCHSPTCSRFSHKPCNGEDSPCEYEHTYDDSSEAGGYLSKDSAWLNKIGSTNKHFEVRGFYFGCTRRTNGTFSNGSVGILGLSGSNLSLIGQLGPSIEYKFSYCLSSNEEKSTRMNFGRAADVSGQNTASTTMHLSNPGSYYLINLNWINVIDPTGRTVNIMLEPKALWRTNSLTVDTGTHLSFVDNETMTKLKNELVDVLTSPLVDVPKKVADSFDLCFDWKNNEKLPKIVFAFDGGAVVPLLDAFTLVDEKEKTLCLTIGSNVHNDGVSIFGNRAQMNHLFGIDLRAGKITIRPYYC